VRAAAGDRELDGEVWMDDWSQLLRSAVTLFDAFVADDIMKGYRVLGTVVED
jgi:hypothetical protein